MRYTRQEGIIKVSEYNHNWITIIGCGAIGSYIATSLTKIGFNKFVLYDQDIVEEHNLPNQFFKEESIGTPKVTATKKMMLDFNSTAEIIEKTEWYTHQQILSEILIVTVDTMEARENIFRKALENPSIQFLIDCRMNALEGHIYTIDLKDSKQVEYYKSTLFKDDEAVQERCTARSILFTVLGITSIACSQIVKLLKEKETKPFIVMDFEVPQII